MATNNLQTGKGGISNLTIFLLQRLFSLTFLFNHHFRFRIILILYWNEARWLTTTGLLTFFRDLYVFLLSNLYFLGRSVCLCVYNVFFSSPIYLLLNFRVYILHKKKVFLNVIKEIHEISLHLRSTCGCISTWDNYVYLTLFG